MKFTQSEIKIALIGLVLAAALVLAVGVAFADQSNQRVESSDPVLRGEAQRTPLGEAVPDWKARWEMARLMSFAKRYPEAIGQYRRVLDEKPDLVEARAELAQVLYWNGQHSKALELLKTIPEKDLSGELLIIRGDLYANIKAYEKAIVQYREYLKRNGDSRQVRLRLAEVLGWAKQYDAAIKQYEELLKADPRDIQIRRKYALVLSWAGKREKAIEELKKTLD